MKEFLRERVNNKCMRKTTLLLLLALTSLAARGQAIRIHDFQMAVADGAASDVRTAVTDPDGELCAALRMETRLSGWTFEAGLSGIMDVRYGEGVIYVYVPRHTRRISVGHKDYAPLRDWQISLTLEAGRTYSMKLLVEKPKPATKPEQTISAKNTYSAPVRTQSARMAMAQPVQPATATVPTIKEPRFCTHFIDAYAGFQLYKDDDAIDVYDYWAGLSYTWLEKRVGAYVSAGISVDDIMFSLVAGPVVRLTSPESSCVDLQIYGGAGIMGGGFAVDAGLRFGWRSQHDVSLWDFGLGCQYHDRTFTPTVSVGLCIWGVPVTIGLGVMLVMLGTG